MSLTSMELNYLVWRYLSESGFDLAAYALEKHSNCSSYEHNANLDIISKIERGCLVNLVQKGILFTVAQEEAISEPENADKLSLFGALLQDELQKQKQLQEGVANHTDLELSSKNNNPSLKEEPHANGNRQNGQNKSTDDEDVEMNEESKISEASDTKSKEEQIQFTTKIIDSKIKFSESLVTDWHPKIDVFAYGKEDSTAVINAINNDTIAESVTLTHPFVPNGTASDIIDGDRNILQKNEVNIVSWSPQGNIIITAGVNGELRAWTPDGKLKNIANNTLTKEANALSPTLEEPSLNTDLNPTLPVLISSLIWSESGQFLISIDVNNQVCLWDGNNLNLIQQIRAPTLIPPSSAETVDACWVGEQKFALSTPNKVIKIYSINSPTKSFGLNGTPAQDSVVPIGYLSGHKNNISILKFNSISKLLASASDVDYVIKIWNSASSTENLELNTGTESDIIPHEAPLVGLFWLNTNETSKGNHLLSISMEGTLNVWDVIDGTSVISSKIFKNASNFSPDDKNQEFKSTNPLIFSVALSPDNKFLVVGDDAGQVTIWNVDVSRYSNLSKKDLLNCVAVYRFDLSNTTGEDSEKVELGICDVSWNSDSSKISVSYKGTDSVILYWENPVSTTVDS